MTVSQLLHVMDQDDWIIIDDYDAPIDQNELYRGRVGDIETKDAINEMSITSVAACSDVILLLVINQKTKEMQKMKTMTFGQAIEALKQGKKVARAGWNGKGMFLWLKPAAEIKTEWCKDPMLVDLCEQNGGTIQALGTICMFTHDSTGRKAILTGWLASQSDMLLEDWYVVGEDG